MRTALLGLFLAVLGLAVSTATTGAQGGAKGAPKGDSPEAYAAQAKEIFRARCFECHGGAKTNGGVKILDHERLLGKKKVVPGKPDDSPLYQAVSATDEGIMPPAGRPKLAPDEIEVVRKWITAGAPPFPADAPAPAEAAKDPAFKDVAGVDYVFKSLLKHVRGTRVEDRRYLRYFSINHILNSGATPAELETHREALAKAVNHMSWEPRTVRLKPIDAPVNSILSVDIRELGWHHEPFDRVQGGKVAGKGGISLWDLVLLEYPYALGYDDSETYDKLMEEYVVPSNQIRAIPYIRADWFVSQCTQPPLYEDMMRLPFTVKELEDRLGVDSEENLRNYVAKRAGMAVSGVSKNNRIVERHPSQYGFYWKSYDYKSSRGTDNMFKEPVNLTPGGGEMIFTLPNGLQGYYLADAKGLRIDSGPTEIVTDKFAEDKTVRNGLSCMRCHDQGMKGFNDNVRPAIQKLPGRTVFDRRAALELYPEQKEMDGYLKEDGEKFLGAMAKVLGKPQQKEPLVPVSHRFLDAPIPLNVAAGELGLGDPAVLQTMFRSPQFAALGLLPLASEGVVRRDAWEDYYDQVIRALGYGLPIAPLDGVVRKDYPSGTPPFEVDFKTNNPKNLFSPGDQLKISVTNKSGKPLYVELIGTSTKGRKTILANADTIVKPGETYTWPAPGALPVKIDAGLGKEQITMYCSDKVFPHGNVLRGKGVTDRVVHRFYRLQRQGGRITMADDGARMVKRTIEIETK